MNILAFESSCDETAVAVVRDGRQLLSDAILSQADMHALYGGVVPEIASRKHVQAIAALSDMLDRSELRQEICHITIYYAIWNIALLVLLAGYQQTGIKYILTDCKLVCRALKYIAFILVLTCKPHIIIDFLQGCIAICI